MRDLDGRGYTQLGVYVYGAAVDWQYYTKMPPEDYINTAMPYIMNGEDIEREENELNKSAKGYVEFIDNLQML